MFSGGSLQDWGSDYGKWFAKDQPDLWLDQVVSLCEVKCHLICVKLVQRVVVVCIRLFCGHWARLLCTSISRGLQQRTKYQEQGKDRPQSGLEGPEGSSNCARHHHHGDLCPLLQAGGEGGELDANLLGRQEGALGQPWSLDWRCPLLCFLGWFCHCWLFDLFPWGLTTYALEEISLAEMLTRPRTTVGGAPLAPRGFPHLALCRFHLLTLLLSLLSWPSDHRLLHHHDATFQVKTTRQMLDMITVSAGQHLRAFSPLIIHFSPPWKWQESSPLPPSQASSLTALVCR